LTKPMTEGTRTYWDLVFKDPERSTKIVLNQTDVHALYSSESYYKQEYEDEKAQHNIHVTELIAAETERDHYKQRTEELERYFKNVTKTSEAVKELIVQRETRIEQLEQENERLEKFIINLQDIGFVTEQRLKAEVEQLEQQLKQFQEESAKWEKEARLQYKLFNEELDASRIKKELLKQAVEVIEFYAATDNYKRPYVRHGDGENIRQDSIVQNDEGAEARAFLQQLKEK
jgi:chromosome segregation ATPase